MSAPKSAAPSPRATCVILNWKDPPRTARCVSQLLESPIDQIYLVDNSTSGQLRRIAASDPERIRLIERPENLGFSAGVNLGLSASLADYPSHPILVINNDAWIQPHDVTLLLRELHEDPSLGLIAPQLDAGPEGAALADTAFNPALMKVSGAPAHRHPDFLTWACVLLQPSAARRVGLLDERFFMYWEDVEYSRRLERSGYAIRVSDTASFGHEVSASHGKAGSRIVTYSTMGIIELALIIGPSAWFGAAYRVLGRLTRAVVRRDWDQCRAVIAGVRTSLRADRSRPAWQWLQELQG